jgi:hypothetical protein
VNTRLLALPFVLGLALGLAGCHTAKPAPQMATIVTVQATGSPQQVLDRIRGDAVAQGFHVLAETVNGVHVDYGVRRMTVPVPTEYGLWGTRVSFRETEVHSSVIYHVHPDTTGRGTQVTLWNNPIYYHPDYKVWLPGPFDVEPTAMLEARAER